MKNRQALEIGKFGGLNSNSEISTNPNEIVEGKNFTIGLDGNIERSKGTVVHSNKASYGLLGIQDFYFHQDRAEQMLAFYGGKVVARDTSGSTRQGFFVVPVNSAIVGATTVVAANTNNVVVGDTIHIEDDLNTNADTTIANINPNGTITLAAPLTLAVDSTKNARLVPSHSDTRCHSQAKTDFVNYLHDPTWITNGDVKRFSNINISNPGKIVWSLNDENRQYYQANSGDLSLYIATTGVSLCVHKDRLWLAGEADLANIVMFTQQYNRLFYDLGVGNVPYLNYLPIGGDSSGSGSVEDAILCIRRLNNEIIVFKNKSIHRIVGDTSIQFQSVELTNTIGCLSARTVAITKYGAIWLDKTGVWLYSGQLMNLSIPKVSSYLANLDQSKLEASYVGDRYYCLTINDEMMLRYDLDTNCWSFEDIDYPVQRDNYSLVDDNILVMDQGYLRQGTTKYDFKIKLPFISMGTLQAEKIFYETVVFYKTGEASIPINFSVDGYGTFQLSTGIDIVNKYNRGHYAGSAAVPTGITRYKPMNYSIIPIYPAKYCMPLACSGYTMSIEIDKAAVETDIRIERIVVYYGVRGAYGEHEEQ